MWKIPDLEFVDKSLHDKSKEELLIHYDNPRNFEVKDCRNEVWENWEKDFPEHVWVFLTHGTFFVPSEIRSTINSSKKEVYRLLKNFSDFWTRKMIKKSGIPKDNIIRCNLSRLPWDANREYRTEKEDRKLEPLKKFVRESDFNEQVIVDNPWQFREIGKDVVEKYWDKIKEFLKVAENNVWGSIWFDIHDTWINLMNIDSRKDKFRPEGFPFMTLWTNDWESCNLEIVEYFVQKVQHHLWITPHINEPFKGARITSMNWKKYREKLWNTQKSKRNMIQIELWRFLYMKESSQEVDTERMEIIWEWLKRAIADTGIKFWEEYFSKYISKLKYNQKNS